MSESAEARRRGPYRKGMEQRRRILGEAAAIFARSGFAGASLRTIAAAVGVSHASVVQLFGTKEGLLLAVLEAWDEDLHGFFRGREGLPFLLALEELMVHHESERGIVELFIVMSAEATNPGHPAHDFIVARSTRVRALVERHVRTATEQGHLRDLTDREISEASREVTAMMNGLELQWLLHPHQKPATVFRAFLRRWLHGLGMA